MQNSFQGPTRPLVHILENPDTCSIFFDSLLFKKNFRPLGLFVPNRGSGRPKNTWIGQMKKWQQRMGLSDDMIQDRNACRRVLRSNTHTSGGA